MADVLEVDPFADGQFVLAFDGRVLEILGTLKVDVSAGNWWHADSWRIHVTQLNVTATGPDKHGYHEVAFCSPTPPKGERMSDIHSTTILKLKLDDTQWDRLQPLLDALGKARGTAAPGNPSDGLLATKTGALQALLSEHGVRLGSQPEDVRNAVVTDLQAAGVPIDPKSLAIAPTDPAQLDAMLEVYQRHGLLPADASIS